MVRLTVPANPLTAVTVIVEVAETPALTAAGEVAATVKSVTVKVALVECERVPLVPVIVTVYVPATIELQARVAVPESVTLAGVIGPQVRSAGTVLSTRLTVPVNPLIAETVIVEDAEVPAWTGAGEVTAMLKSVIVNVAMVE